MPRNKPHVKIFEVFELFVSLFIRYAQALENFAENKNYFGAQRASWYVRDIFFREDRDIFCSRTFRSESTGIIKTTQKNS